MEDAYLVACEDRVREIERLAGDIGMTRPQLAQASIEWYGQEPYKLPLEILDALLKALTEIRDDWSLT